MIDKKFLTAFIATTMVALLGCRSAESLVTNVKAFSAKPTVSDQQESAKASIEATLSKQVLTKSNPDNLPEVSFIPLEPRDATQFATHETDLDDPTD